ncbi:unnamed protein product [Hermetia illucens]|uniref:Ig-like domain-containing protein n=1 Tax=Hermetia illucens TaxID=343691 RepID=A0A7R8YV05_HERIL|nr:uncharacterized protein LOC119653208 [Hermetia illucens]CAD7086357.1 unnamed protein product [Hermetia illucens]
MDLMTIVGRCLWTLVFIISFICCETFSDMGKLSSSSFQNHFSTSASSHFTTKNNTKVVAQKGGLAILPCALKLNSPATVSWIRRRDFQLLTVGLSTHSSDGRFLVEHTRHMGHWSLRIKSVREEDRGLYECQLSVHPSESIFVELKVVEAVAEIAGAPDLHIDEGSTLRLECKLKRATENPSFVFWYHDNKMVNYDSQDGFSVTSFQSLSSSPISSIDAASSNNITSSLITMASLSTQPHLLASSTSILTIEKVHFNHAGNYTCAPSNTRAASITVHVLRGEKPAAMQHANRSTIEDGKSKASPSIRSNATERLLSFWYLIVLSAIYTNCFGIMSLTNR